MPRSLVRSGLVVVLGLLMLAGSASEVVAQVCRGAIGDFVWFDANGDGIRNPGEASAGINGVVLELRDSGGALVATQTTRNLTASIPGFYGFGPLCDGTYTVTIVSGVPDGYVPTLSGQGTDPSRDSSTSPVTVTLAYPDQKNVDVDFGFVAGCTGSIGDRVWNDENQDGIQDAGEVAIAGVAVRLYLSGGLVASTTTDGNGNYSFPGLCPGNYAVVVDTPSGLTPSPLAGTPDTALDSDESGVVVVLGLNESNPTIDFGFYTPCVGTIGDRVWLDANRDGVQDAGESGIAGVTLELVNSGGTVVGTSVSDGSGDYLFTGVCAGSYTVRVVAATLPAGVVATLTGQGTPSTDSNGSPAAVTLPLHDSTDLTIDFGYYTPCSGKIGDFVWNDANANGIQDAGEAGIPDVRVVLRDAGNDAVIAADMTDANGGYLFEGQCAGDYVVEVDPTTLPGGMAASPANQGGNDAVDSDGVNHRATVTLPADDTTDLTIDFGYYRKLALQIVKLTNGTDNNSPTGPQLWVGDVVTWTYRVTSTGSTEPIRDVVVVDDGGTAGDATDDFQATYASGDGNGNGLLDVGETWVFTATGIVTPGQYANWATVTGTGNLSGTPAPPAQDPDHYYGLVKIATGRFTGGGWFEVGGARITRGLTIHCDLRLSNNLEVNWGDNHFHMTEHLTTVACTDSPTIPQPPPAAPLDTLIGIGTGRYNNVDGFTIQFTLVDYGEPGDQDRMSIKIFETANQANVVLDVPLTILQGGNLQAHYDQPHRNK